MAQWIQVHWTPSSLGRVKQWAATPNIKTKTSQQAQHQAVQTPVEKQRPADSSLAGGQGANSLTSFKPTVTREFHRVNEHGTRIGRTRYTAEPGVTPMDVVRKITAKLLKPARSKSRSPTRQTRRIPASVRAAVANAVRQNFMCTCSGKRCISAACHERSVRKGMHYLDQYANDSSRTFTRPVHIFIREKDRTQVREYEGSYRLINNPTRACVRDGVNKEIVVRFVRAFKSKS